MRTRCELTEQRVGWLGKSILGLAGVHLVPLLIREWHWQTRRVEQDLGIAGQSVRAGMTKEEVHQLSLKWMRLL